MEDEYEDEAAIAKWKRGVKMVAMDAIRNGMGVICLIIYIL